MLDKYLECEKEGLILTDEESNKAQDLGLHDYQISKISHLKAKESSMHDLINQIKIECKNFLLSEFKIIILFSLMICIFFYYSGKDTIAFYFASSFFIGIIISLISSYYVTIIAINNCEVVLGESK
jgi:Na+/H+-translocating membrane pyrophosphatase